MDRGTSINIQAIKMTKKVPSTDGKKKEFVYTQQDHTLVIEQINKRTGQEDIQYSIGLLMLTTREMTTE
jgi:hypothetical protein